MAQLLVVEDDETIGGYLESSLRVHGHEVVWQRTGGGALREAETGEFNLVLLDLGLPDLDGVEVCRQLRGRLPWSSVRCSPRSRACGTMRPYCR